MVSRFTEAFTVSTQLVARGHKRPQVEVAYNVYSAKRAAYSVQCTECSMVATSRQVDEVPSPRLVGNRSSLRAGNQLRALRLRPSSSFFHLASLFPSSFLPRPPPSLPLSLFRSFLSLIPRASLARGLLDSLCPPLGANCLPRMVRFRLQ